MEKVVWAEKKKLQGEIEKAREQLNRAIEETADFEICYELSVNLDELIERSIDMNERERGLCKNK